MKRSLKRFDVTAMRYGIDLRKAVAMVKGRLRIRGELREFDRQRRASESPGLFPDGPLWPIPFERSSGAGVASGHYFHQDLYVARRIFERAPTRHIDVGSRIDGFVAHVAAFREIEVIDIRPLQSNVPGITYVQADFMATPPTHLRADSVSCLHALEHFGLGRYGDRIAYDGWEKGLRSLTSIVERGGTLYLSVPTGQWQRVEFNAHRVFSLPFLRNRLQQSYKIGSLAFVDDSGDLHENLDPNSDDAERSFGADYGCSIWTLIRR